jgi:hypothetical protein
LTTSFWSRVLPHWFSIKQHARARGPRSRIDTKPDGRTIPRWWFASRERWNVTV